MSQSQCPQVALEIESSYGYILEEKHRKERDQNCSNNDNDDQQQFK